MTRACAIKAQRSLSLIFVACFLHKICLSKFNFLWILMNNRE